MGPLDGWRKLEKWPHSSDSSEGFLRCNPCGLSVIHGGALRKANRSFLLHCVNAMASPGLGMTPSGPNAALEIPSGNSSDRGTPPPRGKLSYPAKTGRIPSPPQSPAGITTAVGIRHLAFAVSPLEKSTTCAAALFCASLIVYLKPKMPWKPGVGVKMMSP